ncbi:hypothetical protein HA461_13760 [Rhizobium leguminosarum bv. trifolii]|uniref:hypothetical protein n=1 Tax=Rhizobium leguminosarum TaxID=384 RepID=UPI00140F8315|nr:hypothetical protein [Rhizobium leguminosarum]QIO52173.1 hypothetical protein HA461_13760 [Rhizobium leguminosarum bv. trifolii]
MPLLDRTIPSARKAVGFELPIFRSHKGANSDLVQKIAPDGTIERFVSCWLDTSHAFRVDDQTLVVDEGDQAIWVYRNERQKLVIGPQNELIEYGINALSAHSLDSYPLAAAEMAAFCRCEDRFPHVLKNAYAHLAEASSQSADNWRDATVLLPAIREDMATRLGSRASARHLRQVIAVSRDRKTTIYGPEILEVESHNLSRFHAIARVFGIEDARFVPLKQATGEPRQEIWRFVGTGGLASHALSKRPFFGQERPNTELRKTQASASGTKWGSAPALPQLFATVTGSDMQDVDYARRETENASAFRYRHAINVRPMGYGTPSPRKARPEQILRALPQVDVLWVLAAHRLRQTGRYQNGMSVLHVASRTLVNTLVGLIDTIGDRGSEFLEGLRHQHVLGTVGIWRYNNDVDEVENFRRLVYNMLSEDVLLHTVDRIKVLWTMRETPASRIIHIGERRYGIEFIDCPRSKLGSTIVGFAAGVQPARRTADEFRDLCISLMAGYGWGQAFASESGVVMQSGKEEIRVSPVTTLQEMWSQLQSHQTHNAHVIVTNKSVPQKLKNEANYRSISVIHYSELGRWLKQNYGSRLLAERDHWAAA